MCEPVTFTLLCSIKPILFTIPNFLFHLPIFNFKSYFLQVGFFPGECVELIGDKVPQSMASRIPPPSRKPCKWIWTSLFLLFSWYNLHEYFQLLPIFFYLDIYLLFFFPFKDGWFWKGFWVLLALLVVSVERIKIGKRY